MGYSKQTQNYHLPQYVADDRPSYLGDWNEAMGLIDTGMEENKEGLVETNTALANMRTYVDNSIDSLNTSVDNKLNTVDEKLANVYTKPESNSRFVRKLNGGIAVVVGDSITRGTGTSNPSTDNWTVTLAAKRNLTVYNYAQDKAGFVAAGGGTPSRNFVQQLQAAAADPLYDNSNVNLVIIAGGINDVNYVSALQSSAAACFAYAKSTFTNAEIWAVPVLAGKDPLASFASGDRTLCIPPIMRAVTIEGVNCIEGAWSWMIGQSQWSSDEIHPNTAGAEVIAEYINSGLNHNATYPTYKGNVVGKPGTIDTDKVVCTSNNGIVTISGEFKINKTFNIQDTLMTLPEWCKVAKTTSVLLYSNNKVQLGYIYGGKNQIDSFGLTYNSEDPFVYIQTTAYPMGLA